MEHTFTGACHCGAIHFEVHSDPKLIVNCHCDDCKRRNGSAFSTYMAVIESDLKIAKGRDQLKKYQVAESGEKYFCGECGTPIYNKNYRVPGLYLVFYGASSTTNHFTPSVNVFCSSKHQWVDNISKLKSFPESIQKS